MASSKLLRFASGACIVLGVVLVTIGVILTSLSHSLFDEKGFADRAAASLGDPRVAAFVADRIATTIVSEEPDLMPFRPILVGAAGGLVRSEPFRALVRQAARQAHARLFSEGGTRQS